MNTNFFKRVFQILGISLAISLILTFTLGGNDNKIIRYIDYLFIIAGVLLFISLVFGLVEIFLSFKSRRRAKKRLKNEDIEDSAIKEDEEIIFQKRGQFDRLYKMFAVAGFLSLLIDIVVAISI